MDFTHRFYTKKNSTLSLYRGTKFGISLHGRMRLTKTGFLAPRTSKRTGRPDAQDGRPFPTPFPAPMRGLRRPERHQHREEGRDMVDAQLVPGGGGDTKAK
jgi:hypothetical protein